MNTFQYEGHTFDEDDLLPDGERVNPELIADGLAHEATIRFKGLIRHMQFLTEAGIAQTRAEWAAEEEAYAAGIADFALNNQANTRHMGKCVFSGSPEDAASLCIYVQDHKDWWGVDLGIDGNGGVLSGNVVLGSLHDKEPRALILLPSMTPQPHGGPNILELEDDDAVGLALALFDTMDSDHKEAFRQAMTRLEKESNAKILGSNPDVPEGHECAANAWA